MGMTGWQIVGDLNSTKSHGDKLIYSIGVVYIVRSLLELGIGGGGAVHVLKQLYKL